MTRNHAGDIVGRGIMKKSLGGMVEQKPWRTNHWVGSMEETWGASGSSVGNSAWFWESRGSHLHPGGTQRDPGGSKGDPRTPKERPQSVPIGPSCVQEASGRAFGRLRTSFWSFWSSLFHTFGTPQRPSNVCQSCVLCSLFSPLFSLHPGFWGLTRGLRTSTLGPNA